MRVGAYFGGRLGSLDRLRRFSNRVLNRRVSWESSSEACPCQSRSKRVNRRLAVQTNMVVWHRVSANEAEPVGQHYAVHLSQAKLAIKRLVSAVRTDEVPLPEPHLLGAAAVVIRPPPFRVPDPGSPPPQPFFALP